MRKSLTINDGSGGRTRIDDAPATPKASRSKKDRRRWCGGKEGREHQGEWKTTRELVILRSDTPQNRKRLAELQARDEARRLAGEKTRLELEHLICKICGKELKWREKAQTT